MNDEKAITLAELRSVLGTALAEERAYTGRRLDELTQQIAEHVVVPLTGLLEVVAGLQRDLAELRDTVGRSENTLHATVDRVDEHGSVLPDHERRLEGRGVMLEQP